MLQIPIMKAVKIKKWIIAGKKYISLTLRKMHSQLQFVLLPANLESDGITSHKHGLALKYNSKWRPPKSLLLRRIFFRIAGTLAADTSVSQKAEHLLAIGEEKKKPLLG